MVFPESHGFVAFGETSCGGLQVLLPYGRNRLHFVSAVWGEALRASPSGLFFNFLERVFELFLSCFFVALLLRKSLYG